MKKYSTDWPLNSLITYLPVTSASAGAKEKEELGAYPAAAELKEPRICSIVSVSSEVRMTASERMVFPVSQARTAASMTVYP